MPSHRARSGRAARSRPPSRPAHAGVTGSDRNGAYRRGKRGPNARPRCERAGRRLDGSRGSGRSPNGEARQPGPCPGDVVPSAFATRNWRVGAPPEGLRSTRLLYSTRGGGAGS